MHSPTLRCGSSIVTAMALLVMFVVHVNGQTNQSDYFVSSKLERAAAKKNTVKKSFNRKAVHLPIVFEANAGQRGESALFIHRSAWGGMEVRRDDLLFQLNAPLPQPSLNPKTLDRRFDIPKAKLGTAKMVIVPVRGSHQRVKAGEKQRATANVYSGTDPKRNRTGIPMFGNVTCNDVWPGTDVQFLGQRGQLAFQVLLEPGAEVKQVEWEVKGASKVEIGKRGELRIAVEHGELILSPPKFIASNAAQPSKRRKLKGGYRADGNRFGFNCEELSAGESLLIDPTIGFAIFPETVPDESASLLNSVLEVDGTSNVYLCVVKPESIPGEQDYEPDATIHALDVSDLEDPEFVYQTTLEDVARIRDMAVDGDGRLYLGGRTRDGILPETTGAYQPTGVPDVLTMAVLSLEPGSGVVEHATYLGEPNQVDGFNIHYHLGGVALVNDESGNVVVGVGGNAMIRNDAGTSALIPDYFGPGNASAVAHSGGEEWCFATLSANLSELLTMEFLGGGIDFDRIYRLESVDNAFVAAGETGNSSFPTTVGAFQTTIGSGLTLGTNGYFDADIVVARYNADGTRDYTTLLGGPADDWLHAMAVTSAGEPVIGFRVSELDTDVDPISVMAKLSFDGSELSPPSTALNAFSFPFLYGGLGIIQPETPVGAFFLQTSDNGSGTLSPDAFDTSFGGGNEILYAHFDVSGGFQYVSYLGGNNLDLPHDLDVGSDGGVWISGETVSSDFPATIGEPTGDTFVGTDIFLVKIAQETLDVGIAKQDEADPVAAGSLIFYSIEVSNQSDEPITASTLVDQLPTGMTLALIPPGWSVSGNEVTIPVPALTPGESFSAPLTASAEDPGVYSNEVSWIVGGLVQGSTSEDTTVLNPDDFPELLVTIEAPATLDPSELHLNRFRVRNIGPGPAENVVLVAASPSIKTVRFDSADQASATVTGDQVVWPIGQLTGGADVSVYVQSVAGDQAGGFEIVASAGTSTLPDTDFNATHNGAISGIPIDLAVTAMPQETSGDLILRPMQVTGTPAGGEPVGAINVVIEFTATANPISGDVRLVAPGPIPPKIPVAAQGTNRWVLAINLVPSAGLPQNIHIQSPVGFVMSNITVTVSAPSVTDPNESNNQIELE